MDELLFPGLSGFDWDNSNRDKNWVRHRVSSNECEEVFFNEPLIVAEDMKHSRLEVRYYALGKTDQERKLFLVFTIRGSKIRIISARDMSRKERVRYEEI